ncbi:transcription factor grauzone-like isoform X2 [Calliphora vicina]|uniref:transcription factor grauzone-like isoform X2 n=1 Tax=Calliphora vicina TaxID=7373 RepID=UPI00325BBD0B
MVCRLCLKELDDLINIFNKIDGELKMSEVPKKDDPISTVICKHCWLKVYDFHEFYKMVHSAYRVLQDGFTAKGENMTHCDSTNEFEEYCSLPYECESYDRICEIGELPYQMQSKELEESYIKTYKIAPRDVLSDNSICDENHPDTNTSYNEIIVATGKKENTKNICRDINESESSIEKKISHKSTKLKYVLSNSVNKNTIASNAKGSMGRKRGRPKKEKGPMKPRKNPDEQETYKAKIKEYDAEIAKFMSLYCDICNSKSENFPALRVHMRDTHNIKEGYVTCCEKKFNKRALLLYHIRQHLNPSCYRCEECDFTFSDRQSRHNHFLVKHQKDEDKIYACSQCSKKFVRKYLLEQHKSFSHRDSIPKCKNCGKRFKTVEELTEHINKEDCQPGIMCDICAKCIRGTAAFKRHQLEHQGVAVPKVQCDLCGLWYKDKRGLKRHKRKHIEAKEPHVCDICQKISPSRSAMLSHKRYAHGTDRIHECSVCQKTFKKPISLREHMTTHTGEVLYNCPHCPKTFNSNANMHSHRKKVHPKEFEETRKQRKQNVALGEQLL